QRASSRHAPPQSDRAGDRADGGARQQRPRLPGGRPDHDRAREREQAQADDHRQPRLGGVLAAVDPAHDRSAARYAGQHQRAYQRQRVPRRSEDERRGDNAAEQAGVCGQFGSRFRHRSCLSSGGSQTDHLIRLAGTPPYKPPGSQSPVTTAPAATTAPSPMLTPGRIIARAPIQQPSPIDTFRRSLWRAISPSALSAWIEVRTRTWGPNRQSSPISISPAPSNQQPAFTY